MLDKIILALGLIVGFIACDPEVPNSDDIANRQQEQLSKQSVEQVGLPSIVNFQEKRMLKMILELRDSEKLPTTTYITDMNGHLHKICDSIGYGVPYAVQYTNPQKINYYNFRGNYNISQMPQADPNGLFSPPSADGTWVLCLNPANKKVSPVYIEPRIIVSPFALNQ